MMPRNAPVPESRPGLGTGWGKEVESKTGYTSFVRASSKPHGGTDMIYYNNKEGVEAMVDGGWKRKVDRLQLAAGGLVEWGVKSSAWGSNTYRANNRRYVIGEQGEPYTIVVKNVCEARVEVVLSVDGLDVMDGKPASTRKRGYILDPKETLELKGWRTSQSSVASFKFASVGGSYSNLTKQGTRNVGVIGLGAYFEKGSAPFRWSQPEVDRRHSASPFAQAPVKRAR